MSLFSVSDVKDHYPLSRKMAKEIGEYRATIANVLKKKETRFIIIAGPCSLHHRDSAIEYAKRLSALQKKISPSLFLVMRAYVEKPRTYLGWKGMLYDPFLLGQDNLAQGVVQTRDLLIELAKIIPLASEFLDPIASSYFSDLISWGFIGARTSSSQIHRQLASLLPMPVGFKNSTEGSCEGAIYGALSSRQPHSFFHVDETGKSCVVNSSGNHNTHIVLRGGTLKTNYHLEQIENVLQESYDRGLLDPLVVDCSHGNSSKYPESQSSVFRSVLRQYIEGNKQIFGLMVESHIEAGSQSFAEAKLSPYLSVTDPCINWAMTEDLILEADRAIRLTSLAYCETAL